MALTTATVLAQIGWSPNNSTPIMNLSITGDAAYATGGSASFKAFVESKIGRGLESIVAVVGIGIGGGAGYHLSYDTANDKLLVHAGATGLQVANATDLSAVTFNATIIAQ